jgi:ComEC/Rec2-related protein
MSTASLTRWCSGSGTTRRTRSLSSFSRPARCIYSQVSGLHVGIVGYLLWFIATTLHLPRKWAAAVVIPALFFYAAITGLNTSSLRAATMAALVLGAFFVERKVQPINSLAAAAGIILLVNTNQLFAIGFQLSFAVVLAIILLADRISRVLMRVAEPDPFLPRSLLSRERRLMLQAWRTISTGASVSLAAWLGSLLLILPYFYLITPVALIANLLVVPIAFCVLAVGLCSVLLTAFAPPLALVFNYANWSFASAILGIVGLLARAPASHYYLELPRWPSGARAEMTVLDIGAGAAVHLRTRGRDWLFDAGSERHFNRVVRSYLRHRGVNRLEGLLLSHGDSQHVGAAPALLRTFRPREVFDAPIAGRSSTHQAFGEVLGAKGLERRVLAAPTQHAIGRDVTARVLFPPEGFTAKSGDDQALVIQLIVNARWRVLLMSDSGLATERLLLESGVDLKSDILIKGQHHSGISGSPEFLERVAPEVIIATSPDFPEQERIKPEWQALVEQRGIRLLRQDETGAVTLRFFRERWEARSYTSGATFTATRK